MKRIGGLFGSLADVRTLTFAAWRASRGKLERSEVRLFLDSLEAETSRLSGSLSEGSFCFDGYRTFTVRDPKSRTIHAPSFRDRVVHQAMIAITGPVFERGAIRHSYACRLGRGQHLAIQRARAWMGKNDWFLKADVARFYDSIDHELLRCLLARRFRERRLLALFDTLLNSYSSVTGKGLPIGALTSQYLGNFYLDSLDQWVNQTLKSHRYLRYMDDLLFVGEPSHLHGAKEELVGRMEGLGLRLNHGGLVNRCRMGVPYLGFVLYPDRSRLIRLGRRRLRRKFRELERGYQRGSVTAVQLQSRASSLFAHARFGDDRSWRQTVCGFSRVGEKQEPATCAAGRLVDQYGQELPLGLSQQEQAE